MYLRRLNKIVAFLEMNVKFCKEKIKVFVLKCGIQGNLFQGMECFT